MDWMAYQVSIYYSNHSLLRSRRSLKSVILSEAKNLHLFASELQIFRCFEKV